MMRAPISRFVGAVAGIGLVLVLVGWSGAFVPAIEGRPLGSGTSADGKVGYVLAEISNTGALPVEVTDIVWPSDGLSSARLYAGPADGAPVGMEPVKRLRLDGGERRAIMIQGLVDCPLPGTVVTVGGDVMTVVAEPAAGPARTIELELAAPGSGSEAVLPCPGR